jgi:transposase
MAGQPILFPVPEADAPAAPSVTKSALPAAPRLKEPDRRQFVMDNIDLEKLIPADHLGRAIWSVVESLPTEGFLKENKSVEGHAGRPRTSPRMLLAIWVYAYSQGIGQAREIEREMMYEPALRWLAGNSILSFRTLSEFRTAHGEALRATFAGLLAILAEDDLIDLTELTLDGTKIKANAANSSRRREKSLQDHLAKAEEVVEGLENPDTATEIRKQQQAARKRAATEQLARLRKSSDQLAEFRKSKTTDKEREEARVSLTDPESRLMKDGNGAFGLNYNVQVLTETKNKIVVNVAVTQQGNDQQQLEPAMERLKAEGQLPERLIVDGGYRTVSNIEAAQAQGVELIGPQLDMEAQQVRNCAQSLKQAGIAAEFGPSTFLQIEDGRAMVCPAGKRLELKQTNAKYQQYVSNRSDCRHCPHQAQCSPKGQRWVKVKLDNAAVRAYGKRMAETENQERYKKRGPVAEFPHAWWKDKFGFRQFHLRGRVKVETEAWWVALTYNIQQWARLSWRPKLAVA